jgi:hypothetical protein
MLGGGKAMFGVEIHRPVEMMVWRMQLQVGMRS